MNIYILTKYTSPTILAILYIFSTQMQFLNHIRVGVGPIFT